MKKLGLIIRREYITRVRKKSFIFSTIAVPLGFLMIPVLAMVFSSVSHPPLIGVIDRSGYFLHELKSNDELMFVFLDMSLDSAKTFISENSGYDENAPDGILYIPPIDLDHVRGIQYYGVKSLGLQAQKRLQQEIDRILENQKLLHAGIPDELFRKLKSSAPIKMITISESGERVDSKYIAYAIAYIMGFMMYMTILLYGVMVMNGVVEEKSNRIMEVLVSSVRPFELLMGKIIGIGLVGLTQLLIWMIIGLLSLKVFSGWATPASVGTSVPDMQQMAVVLKHVGSMDILGMTIGFIFYFLGGYFLYAALYAAVASAVNDSGDIQSLSLPVTMPVIFAFIVLNVVINDPHGALGFWCSLIPLTSPIVMVGRLPFGVPWWELVLSVVLLVGGFFAAVWVSAKIYRTGILLYGKKPTLREMFRWLTS